MASSSGKVFMFLGKKLILGKSFQVSSSSQFCQLFNATSVVRYSSNSPVPPSPDTKEPFIPAYQQKEGESVETLKARLLYQSRKRGMLENGLLLSTFAHKFLNSMSEPELKDYDRLINLPSNDWDLFYWATGVKPIPKEFDTEILHKFIAHVRNESRESRIRQPDLY